MLYTICLVWKIKFISRKNNNSYKFTKTWHQLKQILYKPYKYKMYFIIIFDIITILSL